MRMRWRICHLDRTDKPCQFMKHHDTWYVLQTLNPKSSQHVSRLVPLWLSEFMPSGTRAVSYHNRFSICWPAWKVRATSWFARKFQHDVLLKSCRLSMSQSRGSQKHYEEISWPRDGWIWKGPGNTPVERNGKSKAEMLQSQHCRPNWAFAKL